MIKTSSKKTVTDEEIRKLIVARLRSLSSDKRISIGSEGEFTKDELINRVEKNDKVGKKIIAIQLQYLKSLKKGLFVED